MGQVILLLLLGQHRNAPTHPSKQHGLSLLEPARVHHSGDGILSGRTFMSAGLSNMAQKDRERGRARPRATVERS